MQTPDSSIPQPVPGPRSELHAPLGAGTCLDSKLTLATPLPLAPPLTPDRVIARPIENHIEVITYTKEGVGLVEISPRRALQLAHDLICHALRQYPK